jgi:thioredoxin-like negative regulator of GroEL|tara:strand:+ start:1710 stop:1970 length:261 start_codon:yes stop_codon:yes gene_type:complete
MAKVIKIYADWCGPCKLYAKTFNTVAEELKDEHEFSEVNIDKDTTGFAAKYKVSNIPATLIIKEDNRVNLVQGRLDKNALIKLINT